MGDQGFRLLENLHRYDGKVAMVTLTPPGSFLLPWDEDHCRHRGRHHHSGPGGCRIRPEAARAFNESAMSRWSSLWESVRVDCHRKFGPGVVRLLAYAPEPQARGAIHLHIVLGCRTPRERKCMRYAARLLARRADWHGWGRVDDRPVYMPLRGAGSAAVYLSKYLTKSEHSKSLRGLVMRGEAPRRAVYVSTLLTRETRCTMRNLRARRYAFKLTGRRHECASAERLVRVVSLHDLLCTLQGTMLRHGPPARDLPGQLLPVGLS